MRLLRPALNAHEPSRASRWWRSTAWIAACVVALSAVSLPAQATESGAAEVSESAAVSEAAQAAEPAPESGATDSTPSAAEESPAQTSAADVAATSDAPLLTAATSRSAPQSTTQISATADTVDANTLVTEVLSNSRPDETAGTLYSPKTVVLGESITLRGTGWLLHDGSGGSAGPIFINQPSGGTGPVSVQGRLIENQIPGSTYSDARAHGVFFSDDQGNWSITIPFPTPANSTLTEPWQVGQTQTIRILTGTLVAGDHTRNPQISFTILEGENTDEPTLSTFENLGQTPALQGSFAPGNTVTASYGRWNPDPENVSYQWLRDGEAIEGATSSSYTIPETDLGASLRALVTLEAEGYETWTGPTPAYTVSATDAPEDDTCVSGPADPDRGKRPMCDTTSATASDGKEYSPTISVEGYLVPGGTVKVTGSGWRPDQVGGVNVRLNDAGTLPSISSGLLEGSGMIPDANGDISGTVTLPSAADFEFLQRTYGSAPGDNWLRFLGTDPSISLHVKLQLPPSEAAPTVVTQPRSATITEGTTVNLVAVANGYPVPEVHWQTRGGAGQAWQNVSGGTSSTLVVTGLTHDQSGRQYRAVFTNRIGSTNSEVATVTVNRAQMPLIVGGTPTISGTPVVGELLTAGAGNWTPAPDQVEYRWLRNGVPISGATGAAYTLVAADAGAEVHVLVTVSKAGYTGNSAESARVLARAATAPPAQNESGCITSPASPDRGKRPICNSNNITHNGTVYSATLSVSGAVSPGGTVTVSGTGWRPGQQVFFRYNDLNAFGAGAASVRGDGTLNGSGVTVGGDGSFSASVTLPSLAAVEWVASQYGTSRTWIRALGSDPALSLYRDIAFQDGSVTAMLERRAAEGAAARAAAAPQQAPAPLEEHEALTEENRHGVRASLDAATGTLTAVIPRAEPGDWVHAYLYVNGSPRSLGWQQTSEDRSASWEIGDLSLSEGEYRLAIQAEDGTLLGWSTIEIDEADEKLISARQSDVQTSAADTAEGAGVESASNPLVLPLIIGGGVLLVLAAGGLSFVLARRRKE